MVEYRCHYLEDGRRNTVVIVEATDDAAVLLKAEELLAESGFVAMEIWQNERFVGRVTVGSLAELIESEGSGQPLEPR
jgi:hypothetical protein